MAKVDVVTAGVMIKGSLIEPSGGVTGGRQTRNMVIHAK
jgi:hypothetical protein